MPISGEEPSNPVTVRSDTRFGGRLFTVESRLIELPDGERVSIDCVNFPDVALVLAMVDDGVVMTRQFRYPPQAWILEAPAGRVDRGETPAETAVRELREETGYSATSVRGIGEIRMSPHLSNEITHVFLAEGLRAGTRAPEVGEVLFVVHLAVSELRRQIAQGSLVDAKTISALVLADLL